MSRLTEKIKGKGKPASGLPRECRVEPRPSSAGGVVIDGVVYPLDGQPPVATSRGWGNLSWLRAVRR